MDTARVEAPLTAPASLAALLGQFRGCFSAWTFPVFCALACGMLAQTGRRTVCAMLVGARLSRVWSHHRAHRFFSHARWSVEAVGVVAARLVVRLLVGPDEAVTVAVDDTLFRRRGPNVHAASWFHDGSAQGDKKVGYGNNWVIAALVVRLAFLDRAVALPVGFALVRKQTDDGSRLACARRLVEALATALPDRRIDVVADSAYAGKLLRGLPATVTWTTRLRSNAALYELAPPRTGKRGRPRTKGAKLPRLATLAEQTTFTRCSVRRYGRTATVQVAVIACLWYGVFGPQQVQVILVRDKATTGYDIALWTSPLRPDTSDERMSVWERNASTSRSRGLGRGLVGSSRQSSSVTRSSWCCRPAGRSLRSPRSWICTTPPSGTGYGRPRSTVGSARA